VAATLAVVYPHMTGIGGDGFWVIREGDGRVRHPWLWRRGGKGGSGLYAGLDAVPWRGPLAANTVAGTISGWQAALESDGGSMPLSRLLRDAIAHAEAGVAVTRGGADIAKAKGPELRIQPGAYATVFEPEGRPLAQGDVLRQPCWPRPCADCAMKGWIVFTRPAGHRYCPGSGNVGQPGICRDMAAHRATRPPAACANPPWHAV
jgi:gamma-glutamyltranspeptidase/glutathione hydrolase